MHQLSQPEKFENRPTRGANLTIRYLCSKTQLQSLILAYTQFNSADLNRKY